jgi:hypothetical protein
MSGYFGAEATREAFRGGWFHSGELGVWHPDGYIQLRDRAKAAWPARPSCSLPEHAAVLVARRRSRRPAAVGGPQGRRRPLTHPGSGVLLTDSRKPIPFGIRILIFPNGIVLHTRTLVGRGLFL